MTRIGSRNMCGLLGISFAIALCLSPFYAARADYFTADDGARIYYRVKGDGPPVLFVHGLLVNSLFWDKNISYLTRDHRVVTIDMRGHGYTWKEEGSGIYTTERVARDIKQLVDFLDLRDIVMVGWSTGAHAIYDYVELFGPHRVSGLVVVDMPPKMVNDATWDKGAFATEEIEALLSGIPFADFEIRQQFVPAVFAEGSVIDENTYDFVSRNFTLPPTEAFLGFMTDLADNDFRRLIQSMPVPLLYCYGERSVLFPNEAGSWMIDNLPYSPENQVVAFERSGHYPQWEEANKFNRVLRRFVADRYDDY